jgi:vacuolar-type H+-ATPase subunit I/STV1
MIETILVAIVRKVIFLALLFAVYKIIDNFYFKAFDTDVVIKENPIAISILLGLFALALAFA